jgi:hypothetical protein
VRQLFASTVTYISRLLLSSSSASPSLVMYLRESRKKVEMNVIYVRMKLTVGGFFCNSIDHAVIVCVQARQKFPM